MTAPVSCRVEMSEHREPPTSRARVIIYTILRALQVAALITIITITARHVSYMKAPGFHVPPLLAAILAFVSKEPPSFCWPFSFASRNWRVRHRR